MPRNRLDFDDNILQVVRFIESFGIGTGGVLLVTFPSQHAIGCWNVQNPMKKTTAATLRTDETTLQYVNAIKITLNADGVGQTFWGLSNRNQNFVTGVMDLSENNIRILREDLASMVNGTVCAPESFEMADGSCLGDLNPTREWKYIDYVWENRGQKADAVAAGVYRHDKIITVDIQPLTDGRVLVTTPRYFNNPASLSTISDETGDGGPLLAPYPNWTWHSKKDCSGITSVDRLVLDDLNRVWLVDSGRIGARQVCLAKILAFNTTTDELLRTIEIPRELSKNPSRRRGWLAISAVETNEESPEDIWVYISDLKGGLLIWDGRDVWRLDDEVYNPHCNATNFSVAGENVTMRLGLSNSGITPKGFLKKPVMIFQPTSAYRGYAVTVEDLHNSKFPGSNVTYYVSDFVGPSQELERIYSLEGGVMIAGFPTETAVECWNLQYPLDVAYIANLAVNETTLQFVSGIKVGRNSDRSEVLYVTSNRLQKFVAGTMDFAEINFRILTGNLTALVAGTVCEPKAHEIVDSIEDKAFAYLKTSRT